MWGVTQMQRLTWELSVIIKSVSRFSVFLVGNTSCKSVLGIWTLNNHVHGLFLLPRNSLGKDLKAKVGSA